VPAVLTDSSVAAEKLGTSRWWTLKDSAAPAALWGWIDRLRSSHHAHALMDLVHEAIYEDRPLGTSSDVSGAAYLRREASAPATLNITRSMVDTVVARLGKRRPMPCISADDAGWSEKRFAQRASRVLRRKMGQSAVERMCPVALRSAVIRGTGVAKVYSRNGDVAVEEVPRYEIVVDPRDARYGAPRTMAQVKLASRDVLASRFPKAAKDIREAPVATREFWEFGVGEDIAAAPDQIEVAESWHLPSSYNADDGGHIISIRGKVLFREKWKRERYPFAFMHWSAPTRGFWGHGLVEDLRGIQAKVNDLARDAQQALWFASALKIFAQRGSNLVKQHLRSRDFSVVETDGAVPQYIAPSPISPQTIQFLEWLLQQAYQISGISQASAASKNPLGSNASGKALDTMYDLESDRFSHVELQYAMFRVDIGHCMLDEARAIANDNEDPKARKAAWISEIDWDKVDVDCGDYHLILEPVNFLTDSRSGKLDQVNDLAKAGLLNDPMQTAALFDEPDLVRANRHLLGPYRLLERIMEDLANVDADLEPLTPTPYLLAFAPLAKSMALGELCNVEAEAKNDNDDKVADRFRWFLDMLKAAGDAATAQATAAPPPGALGADPNAPPMPGPPGAPPPGMPMIPADAMGGMASQAAAGMPVPMQGMAA
jgi:hypothetical protein